MSASYKRLGLCMRNAGSRYADGLITREQMIEIQVRGARLRARRVWMLVKRKREAKHASRRKRVEWVREIIASGELICAMDTEFCQRGPVEQLGITRYEGGVLTTMTFTVDTATSTYVDRPSLYGPDFVVTREELKKIAQDTYAEAAVTAFHDYSQDVSKLEIDLNQSNYVDTSRLTYSPEGTPGLRDICESFGIPMLGPHNGGNDSRYTLQALLAIVNDPLASDPNHPVNAAQRARDEERRRIMMLPTRLPIPDRAMFDELREEAQRAMIAFKERERRFTEREKKRKALRDQARAIAPCTPVEASVAPAPVPDTSRSPSAS